MRLFTIVLQALEMTATMNRNTPPHVNRSDLALFGSPRSPSQRSSTSSIATNTRTALDVLYKTVYGQDSIRCLLTQGEGGLNVAHAVRCASKSPEVRCVCG